MHSWLVSITAQLRARRRVCVDAGASHAYNTRQASQAVLDEQLPGLWLYDGTNGVWLHEADATCLLAPRIAHCVEGPDRLWHIGIEADIPVRRVVEVAAENAHAAKQAALLSEMEGMWSVLTEEDSDISCTIADASLLSALDTGSVQRK
jgi:hypothetical protein